ncbi:hypothetical protein CC80DRAFT_597131 [Byssothecium circinans]|uniref:Uncharacterized protein n=1 Tax=Byssothecium circinans TaxID=147558 RepID=A0A6A5TJ35_9PLEO|nr:hypothetical protein CC80DRAFT_597131 [Byssothecium circinans]
MGLKRKRSIDLSPVSISSISTHTPEAQSPTPFPHDTAMEIETPFQRVTGWDFSSVGRVKSGDWGVRTRKRARDNRPDERAIHENTIHKLFTAQRQNPRAEPIPSDTLPAQHSTPAVHKPQKYTLHAFWKLPAPPVHAPIFQQPQQQQRAQTSSVPHCEDCDAPLHSETDGMGMDVDMEVEGQVERGRYSCNDCGRNVCGTCAVVSSSRHCLQCATSARNSRRWW